MFYYRQKRGKIVKYELFDIFKEFVIKVASLKSIKKIFLEKSEYSYRKDIYTKDELKKLFPEIDFNRFHEIKITYF